MNRPPILNSRGLAALAGVVIAATSVFALLWALALAPDQSERLAGIRRLAALASPAPTPGQPTSVYAPGAVCGSALAAAETLLKIRLSDAAKAAGVEIIQLDLTSIPGEPLSSVQLTGRVEGAYGSGLNFMKILADQTPTIFLDSLKTSKTAGDQTSWDFEGRVYCSVRLPS